MGCLIDFGPAFFIPGAVSVAEPFHSKRLHVLGILPPILCPYRKLNNQANVLETPTYAKLQVPNGQIKGTGCDSCETDSVGLVFKSPNGKVACPHIQPAHTSCMAVFSQAQRINLLRSRHRQTVHGDPAPCTGDAAVVPAVTSGILGQGHSGWDYDEFSPVCIGITALSREDRLASPSGSRSTPAAT
jgi:hypothetical protein